MGLFRKLFKKSKKEEKPQEKCWYNNAHEVPSPKWIAPEEGAIGPSPNSGLYSTAMQAARNQNR